MITEGSQLAQSSGETVSMGNRKTRERHRESFVAVLVAVGYTIVSRSLRERERKSFLGERFSSFFSTLDNKEK